MKNFKNLLAASAALLTANFVLAQTWTQTSAPTNYWSCVASSADGTKLVAVGSRSIFTSTDSGATWISNDVPEYVWSCVASSADGTKLAVGSASYSLITGYSPLWISTDSGATWISNNAPNAALNSMVFSADGTELVALGSRAGNGPGIIFISTNSGTTWASTNADEGWETVACSADGTKLVATASPGLPPTRGIYTSTNSGSSWTLVNSSLPVVSAIASSADGTKLAAIAPSSIYASSIYVSTDSGITWTITSAPATNWVSIASSADGSRLVVVAEKNYHSQQHFAVSGLIYSSTNSGATWIHNNVAVQNWSWVASSADGCKLVAADTGEWDIVDGGIWTLQTTPAPQMNIKPAEGTLALSWIVPSTNFVLQQSPDLSSWMDVTNPPVLNLTNLQNEVMLSPSNSSGFYRLKTP